MALDQVVSLLLRRHRKFIVVLEVELDYPKKAG